MTRRIFIAGVRYPHAKLFADSLGFYPTQWSPLDDAVQLAGLGPCIFFMLEGWARFRQPHEVEAVMHRLGVLQKLGSHVVNIDADKFV